MSTRGLDVATVADMEALGARLAAHVRTLRVVTVRGPLGAGKTTLVRGLLRALGHTGAVKSPTFTLVEPYTLGEVALYHFDLYRLKAPEELELMGLRDYLAGAATCVIEWAERGGKLLPRPDIDVMIDAANSGRRVTLTAHTENGEAVLGGL